MCSETQTFRRQDSLRVYSPYSGSTRRPYSATTSDQTTSVQSHTLQARWCTCKEQCSNYTATYTPMQTISTSNVSTRGKRTCSDTTAWGLREYGEQVCGWGSNRSSRPCSFFARCSESQRVCTCRTDPILKYQKHVWLRYDIGHTCKGGEGQHVTVCPFACVCQSITRASQGCVHDLYNLFELLCSCQHGLPVHSVSIQSPQRPYWIQMISCPFQSCLFSHSSSCQYV